MHENFHTKHSVLTAPDEHMPYIIQLHIMSIRERERERERETETETEREREREREREPKKPQVLSMLFLTFVCP